MAGSIAIHSSLGIASDTPVSDAQVVPTLHSKCMPINLSSIQFHDESRDLLSSHLTNILMNTIQIVFCPLLVLVGFPSNVLNMVVFFKHGLRQRINLCLFCLSLTDLVLITMAFLMNVEKLPKFDFNSSYRSVSRFAEALINNRMLWLYSGSSTVSQFISAIIAGDRCLCVVRPLQSTSLLTTKDVGLVLLVGVLLILAGRVVLANKYFIICVVDSATGLTSYLVTGTEFYKTNRELLTILEGMVYGLALPVIFSTLVVIATIIMALHLQKSTEFHKESSSSSAAASSSRNVAVTRMLIYLSIQFIVLSTPAMLTRVSLVFLPELSASGDWANLFFSLSSVFELCAVLNSSLNVLVYYLFGSKYRNSVLEMVGKCRRNPSNAFVKSIQ